MRAQFTSVEFSIMAGVQVCGWPNRACNSGESVCSR